SPRRRRPPASQEASPTRKHHQCRHLDQYRDVRAPTEHAAAARLRAAEKLGGWAHRGRNIAADADRGQLVELRTSRSAALARLVATRTHSAVPVLACCPLPHAKPRAEHPTTDRASSR